LCDVAAVPKMFLGATNDVGGNDASLLEQNPAKIKSPNKNALPEGRK
jgi:hypothetical protein